MMICVRLLQLPRKNFSSFVVQSERQIVKKISSLLLLVGWFNRFDNRWCKSCVHCKEYFSSFSQLQKKKIFMFMTDTEWTTIHRINHRSWFVGFKNESLYKMICNHHRIIFWYIMTHNLWVIRTSFFDSSWSFESWGFEKHREMTQFTVVDGFTMFRLKCCYRFSEDEKSIVHLWVKDNLNYSISDFLLII